MSDHEMTVSGSLIQDLSQVRPGDFLEAVSQGVVRHRGVVVDTAPDAGVVWVRETGIGDRKMLAADTCELHVS